MKVIHEVHEDHEEKQNPAWLSGIKIIVQSGLDGN
jgi:hypothetical protein